MIGLFFVILVGYFLLRKMLLGVMVGDFLGHTGELKLRILSVPRTLLMYFSLIIFPKDLHYYRSMDILQPNFLPAVLFGIVIFLFLVVLKFIRQENRRFALFGLAWFFITLGPTLNIVPLINEYSYILTAEHFLYLPLAGALMFLVAALYDASDRLGIRGKNGRSITVILCLLVFICVGLTVKQNRYWFSEIALFERTLQFEPNFGRVRNLLAKAYYFNKQY